MIASSTLSTSQVINFVKLLLYPITQHSIVYTFPTHLLFKPIFSGRTSFHLNMRNDSLQTSAYAMEKLIFGRVPDNDQAGDDSPMCITNIRQKIPIPLIPQWYLFNFFFVEDCTLFFLSSNNFFGQLQKKNERILELQCCMKNEGKLILEHKCLIFRENNF